VPRFDKQFTKEQQQYIPKITTYFDEQGIEYDVHGNIISEKFDLGRDGSFNDFSLLIGAFINRFPLCNIFVGLAVQALQKKGFMVTYTTNEGEFVKYLSEKTFDVTWIISGNVFENIEKMDFMEAVIDYHKKGGGLMIYGDNDPYYVHANEILPSLVGCSLTGDTKAGKILKYGTPGTTGFFDENHLVFAGINNLYEGITICYPDKESKLVTLATSTDDHPCILMCEFGLSNFENGGRIIVDTGWTKLYCDKWGSAGQARYVVNATVWLLNLEHRFGKTVDDFK